MTAIAAALTAVVAAIAMLHFYWTVGGLWPGRSPAELAATVVGVPGMTAMPSTGLSVFVTLALAAAAAWPLAIAPLVARLFGAPLTAAGSAALALLFLGRGIAGLTPLMARHAAEPFAQLNRQFYAPLCLAIGGGYLVLALNGVLS